MTILKTHLLFEAMDIACKKQCATFASRTKPFLNFTTPKDACALAISSAHGYRIIAYALKHVVTYVEIDSDTFQPYFHWHNIIMKFVCFSPKYHIRALMNLAGRFCTIIRDQSVQETDGFIDAFYDGLAFNQVMESNRFTRDPKVFRAYIKGREFIDVKEYTYFDIPLEYDFLQDVGDIVIRTLHLEVLTFDSANFDRLNGLKIEELKVVTSDNRLTVTHDIFGKSRPQMEYMKRFEFHTRLSVDAAIKLLRRYNIDQVLLPEVRLVRKRGSFVQLIESLRKSVDTLWNAIVNNKGIQISIRCSIAARIKDISSDAMVNHLSELLPDYEVQRTVVVKCKYSKQMASLKTHLLFEALDIAFKKVKPDPYKSYSEVPPSFWKFSEPKDVCTLAISSSHGYRMVAYTLKHFATTIDETPDSFVCGALSFYCFVPVVSFSSKYHIDAMMNIAGCYCILADCVGPENGGFTDAFYDGLAFNDVIRIRETNFNQRLFRAYMKGRDSINHLCAVLWSDDHYHYLQDVGDVLIHTLAISEIFHPVYSSTFGGLTGLKIENLTFDSSRNVIIDRDVFYNTMPQLEYMKRFHFKCPFTATATVQMLQRYDIADMSFDDVRYGKMFMPFEEHVKALQKTVDGLWNAIEESQGQQIVVHFRDSQKLPCSLSVTNATFRLYELLPDFDIYSNESLVTCSFQKTLGSKKLIVLFRFSRF